MIRNVSEAEMVDALIEEIDIWEKEESAAGRLKSEKTVADKSNGRTKLPVLN
jgi:hypothetical protein